NGLDGTNATDGADTFNISPSPSTTFNVSGDQPAAAPGDTLNVNTAGTPGAFLTIDAVNGAGVTGSFAFPNFKPVNLQGVERLLPQFDLSITKTDNVPTAVPGTTITYTITATNNGPLGIRGVKVTDTFPTGPNGLTSTSYTRSFSSASSGALTP